MRPITATARPRAGLLGNPSDLYGGKVIAFTFDAFAASVHLEPAEGIELVGGTGSSLRFDWWSSVVNDLEPTAGEGGADLMAAALARLLRHAPVLRALLDHDPRAGFRASFETDVPRQAGLAGSSALVIAALRAWARWFDLELSPFELSELALAAEVEELAIQAGPQDRVAQAFGRLVAMDFTRPRGTSSYTYLDASLLPPLLVTWDPQPGRSSGAVHAEVRARWLAGDRRLRTTMSALAGLVDEGVEALDARDAAAMARLVDTNFDLRASVFPISDRDRRMIEIARGAGAGAKLCGSGGAVLAVTPEEESLAALESAYAGAGFPTLRPRVTR